MSGIIRHRDAPFECAAADGEIPQPAANKGNHFVTASLRTNELRLARIEFQKLVLECGELEEIVFFADRFRRIPANGARRARPTLSDIEFV